MKKQKLLWYFAAAFAVLGACAGGVAGMRFSAALCWCAAIALIGFAALDRMAETKRWAERCRRVLLGLFCLGLALFAALETMVVRGARSDAPEDVSCVVILGAGVDGAVPSVTLRTRLDAALGYLADKPALPVVVTGGQGGGEEITEAECMARYLIAHGVDESRILREDRATSTRTNFANSYALMAEHGLDPADGFAFVTSDFHICRAKYIAGTQEAHGVAAKLPDSPYYRLLTLNYYVREAFALANELFLGVDL